MPAKGHGVHLLSRPGRKRRLLYKALLTNLIKHERIQTTVPRAKALKIQADRMITLGKKGDEYSLKRAAQMLNEKPALVKLFTEMADRYKYRPGGYTRMIRTQRRYRDNAPMCYIEYIDRPGELRAPTPCDKDYLEQWQTNMDFYHENLQYIFPRSGEWTPTSCGQIDSSKRIGPGPLANGPMPEFVRLKNLGREASEAQPMSTEE